MSMGEIRFSMKDVDSIQLGLSSQPPNDRLIITPIAHSTQQSKQLDKGA